MHEAGLKPSFYWRFVVPAEQVAEIRVSGPSGVKTPEENADFMSRLKARPTKLKTFSAACEAAPTTPIYEMACSVVSQKHSAATEGRI